VPTAFISHYFLLAPASALSFRTVFVHFDVAQDLCPNGVSSGVSS
jgi:hypothetical protein